MRKFHKRGLKDAKLPSFRLYDLRHTYASLLRPTVIDEGHALGNRVAARGYGAAQLVELGREAVPFGLLGGRDVRAVFRARPL